MNFCVSMTSVPPRFSSLEKTLNSLENQNQKPEKIFLNIPNIFNRFKNIEYDFDNLTKKFSNILSFIITELFLYKYKNVKIEKV